MTGQIHVVTPTTRAHENVVLLNTCAGRVEIIKNINEMKAQLKIGEATPFVAFLLLPSKMNNPGFQINDPY